MTPELTALVTRLDTATINIGGIPTRLDIFDEAAAALRDLDAQVALGKSAIIAAETLRAERDTLASENAGLMEALHEISLGPQPSDYAQPVVTIKRLSEVAAYAVDTAMAKRTTTVGEKR